MRKLIIFLCIMGLSLASFADRYVSRPEDIKAFLKTTTYIVLEDNPMSEYNIKIKKAVERSWTITPYAFITAKEFEEQRNDINKSFLVKLQVKFDSDKVPAAYHFMSIVMGAAVKKHTDLPDICSIPMSYSTVPEDSYAYKLESFIRFAQNHIKMLDQNPELIKKGNIFKHYNKNVKNTKTKELWLLEKDVDKATRSMSDLRKNYPHPVKYVTEEDIEKAIAEKNENVVFLHKVGPEGTRLQARCYKVLIGAGDDQFYYFDYHTINKKVGDGILAKDLKKLAKK